MLELNETQTRILKVMSELQMGDYDNTQGITSYAIRNQGIPGRTFNTNKDTLLYHQLIRITKEEKTGKQTRVYYELTPLGFFGLVKSLANANPTVLKKYVKFIPHLGAKWEKYNDSLKPYQFILPRLLKRAIDEININPQYRLHSKDNKFRPRIDENTRLIFENLGLDLRISELYYPTKKEKRGIHHNTFFNKKEKIWRNLFSKEMIQVSEHMIERMIFLFYFNAFKLDYDDRFGFHIFNDFHVSEFDDIGIEIPKEHEKIEDFEEIKKDYKDKWDKYDKFWSSSRNKFLNDIYKDVFEDENILYVFAENFSSVTKVFKKPQMIQELEKIVMEKMIGKGIEYGIIKTEKAKDSNSGSKN